MNLCGFPIGLDQPFFLIAGPCVIESEQMAMDTAGHLQEITKLLQIPFIYKSSFDKANRSSGDSFRGLGMERGLEILAEVKSQLGVSILTDIHSIEEIKPVCEVVDVLQTPAFLCRQTDFIQACAQSGRPVNIKKGQFLAPHDMVHVIKKARSAAKAVGLEEDNFMACERGVSFAPVVFDATHSVQLPGGQGATSGGQREFVPVLARAAMAVGISGIFMETHPDPAQAMSDGPNAVPLKHMKVLLETLKEIDQLVKRPGMMIEHTFGL